MYPLDDTIAAIATAPRGGIRGIIRLSGPDSSGVVSKHFVSVDQAGRSTDSWRSQSTASVTSGSLQLDEDRQVPCELYCWPTSQSYTRQPTIELHTIGSLPILERLLQNLCRSGARLAGPGEFTLRAFLAGRLDLTQAEAVLGVIDADNDDSLKVALRQLAGGLSAPLNELRDDLLNLCADIEAGLDFVEDDIEFVSQDEVVRRLRLAESSVEQLLAQMEFRGASESTPRVTLIGPPNAGKSSLMNCIVGSATAIVSPVAGTTRDYVTAIVELDGVRFELVDTAGIEDVAEGPAGIAQSMTESANEQSQLRLVCVDLSAPSESREQLRLFEDANASHLVVATKSDIAVGPFVDGMHVTSSQSGEGIADLVAEIRERLVADTAMSGQLVGSTTLRCRTSLTDCQESLGRAAFLAIAQSGDELVAAEIRTALDQLGQVVGAVYTDDVLDRVFSRFCIGK